MIGVRDWYIGCARPSQGRETGSTPVSRFSFELVVQLKKFATPRLHFSQIQFFTTCKVTSQFFSCSQRQP